MIFLYKSPLTTGSEGRVVRDDGEGYEKVNSHDRQLCNWTRYNIILYIIHAYVFLESAASVGQEVEIKY